MLTVPFCSWCKVTEQGSLYTTISGAEPRPPAVQNCLQRAAESCLTQVVALKREKLKLLALNHLFSINESGYFYLREYKI